MLGRQLHRALAELRCGREKRRLTEGIPILRALPVAVAERECHDMAPVKHEIYQTNPLSILTAIRPVPPPTIAPGAGPIAVCRVAQVLWTWGRR